MTYAEQIQDVRRRQIEILFGMTSRAVEGAERLIDLQLRTARSAVDQASQTAIASLDARDVQSLVGVRLASLQPAAEKFSAYSRDVSDIVSATGADLVQIAGSAAAEVRQQFLGAFERAAAQASEVGRDAAVTIAEGSESAGDVAEAALASSRQLAEDADTVLQNAASEAQAAAAAAQAAAVAEPGIIVSSDAAAKPVARNRRNPG